MENLFISLKAMVPLFFPMVIGYVSRRANIISEDAIPAINNIIFQVFLPFMVFGNIYGSRIAFLEVSGLAWYLLASVTLLFLILSFVVPKLVAQPDQRGPVIQAILRANTAIYGVPIGVALLGEAYLPIISIAVAIIVIPFNVFSILALEVNRGRSPGVKHILKQVLANHMLIAIFLVLVLNALPFQLPALVIDSVRGIGGVTTPLAFFVLGASFTFSAAAKNKKILLITTFVKLVAVPAFYLLPAALLGFGRAELVCVLLVSAPPTAVSSYPMASALGGDAELASELVVFTSAFSIFTMFFWIYLLKSLMLI